MRKLPLLFWEIQISNFWCSAGIHLKFGKQFGPELEQLSISLCLKGFLFWTGLETNAIVYLSSMKSCTATEPKNEMIVCVVRLLVQPRLVYMFVCWYLRLDVFPCRTSLGRRWANL